MRFSEFISEEQAIEPPPIIIKIRVGAASALKAKQIIERNPGQRLLAYERDGEHAVLTVAVTESEEETPDIW